MDMTHSAGFRNEW